MRADVGAEATGHGPRAVLERLRAIDWKDETGGAGEAGGAAAWEHAASRALLMREYLRRSALWAQACGAEAAWPFFDVAEHLDAGAARTPPDVAAELEDLLNGLAPASLRTTCRAAVRWAAVRDAGQEPAGGLPDPYEPLLLMYERGGGYYLEEYVDLNGTMIPLGDVAGNAAAAPFLTLAPATLDAMDAEGETAYYAEAGDGHSRENPGGILRRRTDEDRTYDEAFTRNLRWEPTAQLRPSGHEHGGTDCVRIADIEAAAFIEAATKHLGGSR
ncbi:hypothetical protein [Streptomyces sp. NPDC090445]|uniref:hypothetical protein n=1 Tax=Streptomyces sp. NPDC090445 TaxID=3365963 RepID=UPI003813F79D